MNDMTGQVPLCVDLDGTLIRGDSLLISLRVLLRRRPWLAPLLPLWLIRGGKAGFKHGIAARVVPGVSMLPYNTGVLDWIRSESRSRPVVLATAAHHRIAGAVADHLGVFSRVVATDGENVSGPAKAAALVGLFGERGFDYAGNAREDLHVWAHARHAIVVDAPAAVEAAACAAGNVVRIYRAQTCEQFVVPR